MHGLDLFEQDHEDDDGAPEPSEYVQSALRRCGKDGKVESAVNGGRADDAYDGCADLCGQVTVEDEADAKSDERRRNGMDQGGADETEVPDDDRRRDVPGRDRIDQEERVFDRCKAESGRQEKDHAIDRLLYLAREQNDEEDRKAFARFLYERPDDVLVCLALEKSGGYLLEIDGQTDRQHAEEERDGDGEARFGMEVVLAKPKEKPQQRWQDSGEESVGDRDGCHAIILAWNFRARAAIC